MSRDGLLLLVYLFESVVRGELEVSKADCLKKLQRLPCAVPEDASLGDWPRVRETLKSMRRKYKAESSSHHVFEEFLAQAKRHWESIM